MAKIFRVAQVEGIAQVGLLSESHYLSPESTIQTLLDVHFPGTTTPREDTISAVAATIPEALSIGSFITTEKIRWAISLFGNTKAAGPDRWHKARSIEKLPEETLEDMRVIFSCSLLSGYVCKEWRQFKMIYIPKLGKADYFEAKSFRPITLTSFVFKAMEKVVLSHLEDHHNIYVCTQL